MHIWHDKQSSTTMHHKTSSKKMDYSHCPLKKRPVHFVKNIKEEMDFDTADEYAEPENLSTKPQDLSVKCKPNMAVVVAATTLDVKKELPYQYDHYQQQQQQQHQQQHYAVQPQSSPLPQPPPAMPLCNYPQHPYQPTALKQGPLEPLCLNIASDHPATVQYALATSAAAVSASAYHHHHHHHHHHQQQQQQNRGGHAAPRPVPAQYPSTGYLTGYNMYHQQHQHGGLQMVERAYPVSYPATMVAAGTVVRDASLSPPGSGRSGSAFKPLHASPPSAAATVASCSPPMMTWYGRNIGGGGGGWSPPPAIDIVEMSPPLTSSSSLSAVSPPALPPPPPPPPPSSSSYCSGDSGGSPAAAIMNATAGTANMNARKSIAPVANATERYKCTTCSKTYLTVSGLTKHHQYHCTDDEYVGNVTAAAAAAAAAAKSFCCKYCDKAYNTLGALKMHIRTHTLPCICKLCGKAFSRPWLLQGHIRTHTGEKPFSCQHCNRAFADRSNLRAHLQTHSDVKKYSCATCSKTFSRMSLLTKHCDTGCPRLVVAQPMQQQ